MEKELTTENATAKKQHAASIVTSLMLAKEWDDIAMGDREGERPMRPIAPEYETLYLTPLDQFGALTHKLYPARSTERMTEYLECVLILWCVHHGFPLCGVAISPPGCFLWQSRAI
jgi:hypothetical protein